ncbi:TonB-dependent receptor family protein [Gilvimarinus sp. 1_MG-2023]|uniref:TonB-dependent receptor family protein n=1 Tax=Gilvimarinus sp. 1_MG-2023 TaxID=3062638 RepID=UPI0026E488D2|nr:TonB-dependent receptor [Gilvimarinus sp. 1_MG-2023]MDO6746160.1 TonB-dependent receptor [Gilvimarinus sp. 1_MG-2023]
MIKPTRLSALALCVLTPAVQAQQLPEPMPLIEEMLVTGGQEAVRTSTGSASYIDKTSIAEFDTTDLGDLMAQVPGVYIRQEDGFGLRPNIGIRGATAERSQKITLMEDGILIAPAPYSAPAAYYVPNVNRMNAVEVFKGPAAIVYGPHTVGGAINMATAPLATERSGELSLAAGDYGYHKERLRYSDGVGQWQFAIDGLRYGADGFKQLDGGGDTGFIRNDINAKLGWHSAAGADISQSLVIKLGYADETSDETYLGTTDADFAENSLRRYSASTLDEFTSEHSQLHIIHSLDTGNVQWINRAYINRFDRAWNKFDGFLPDTIGVDNPYAGALDAGTLMSNAELFTRRMAIVRGEIDLRDRLSETLDITNNAREYGSSGVDSQVHWQVQTGTLAHNVKVGLRYHHDYVDRYHQVAGYVMRSGELVFDGVTDRPAKVINHAQSDALALSLRNEITWHKLKINMGARAEKIEGEVIDHVDGSQVSNTQDVLTPGAGFFYALSDSVGILAGINQGYSPAGPGADSSIEPEQSTNVEYGVRYREGALTLDAIGFFSDYKNLLGRCRVSDTGCEVGEEFNGGAVEIAGVEITARYLSSINQRIDVPFSLVYTYSESAFQSDFISGFSQWGSVQAGDELPYTPEHQLRLQGALEAINWQLSLALNFNGEMREQPGQGALEPDYAVDSLMTIDLSAHYQLNEAWRLELVVENITDEQQIVSRRPFGARSNAPRLVQAGVSVQF